MKTKKDKPIHAQELAIEVYETLRSNHALDLFLDNEELSDILDFLKDKLDQDEIINYFKEV
jgi:hypothetical protein